MRLHDWLHRLLNKLPTERHLRGSHLHRLLGERLFLPELWKLTREGVIRGATLGIFIGLTPTIGVQAILAGMAALGARVNVPVALMATLVSNPLSAPFIYTFEYRLGLALLGAPEPEDLAGYSGAMKRFLNYAEPLWAGSVVVALLAAGLTYLVLNRIWHPPPDSDSKSEMP